MLKSSGPSELNKKNNAADHFKSTAYIAEPAFEPAAMIQQKEDSTSKVDGLKNENTSSNNPHSGSKLPTQLRAKMENSFESDFSNVQIETDSSEAQDMGAKAYAQGNKVAFAPGAYDPDSKQGQNLIGHELTHVVQQRSHNIPVTQQFSGVSINNDQSLEREADQKGKLAAEGQKTGMQSKNTQVQSSVTQGFGWNDGKNFLNKVKKKGQEKVNEGAAWGQDKANKVKGFGLNKGHDIWSNVKEKANEGRDRLEEKKNEVLDKFPGIPEVNIQLVRSLANTAVDTLKYKIAEIDNRFETKILPVVQRLKTFIQKNVDPVQIIQMITQTLHRIVELLEKKINELKGRLEDTVDLETLANFFKSLSIKSIDSVDDSGKFLRLLLNEMNEANTRVFNRI